VLLVRRPSLRILGLLEDEKGPGLQYFTALLRVQCILYCVLVDASHVVAVDSGSTGFPLYVDMMTHLSCLVCCRSRRYGRPRRL